MAKDSRTSREAVMKSLTAFLQEVLLDLGDRCHTSTTNDLKKIIRRVEFEGESFLTITLASFGKDFEKSLDQGFVSRCLFLGFAWKDGLPAMLGGFLGLVFDRGTGRLLEFPSIEAIRSIRQFTLMWSKMELPCSDARVQSAFDGYLKCEQDLRVSDRSFTGKAREDFLRVKRLLWTELFTEVDNLVYSGGILPKHSSGSTADGLRGNAKYNQNEWTDRLEEYFPAGEFLFNSWKFFLEADVRYLEPGEERPVKVITVPKTLKTPRIIAMEPTCMQYVQQGLLEAISEAIRRIDIPRQLICSDSQDPNRILAQRGSLDGTLATLDLSEASDRVSNQHVRALLEDHPHLSKAVDASRSRKADVQGKTIRLAKFASMGSALCFPFEAMVFTTIVFMGIEDGLNRQLTREDIKSFFGQVRVYGDDIIVPVDYVDAVVQRLSSFGMKVNLGKSFWTGKFRESCGGDYYDGSDVSIVRVKTRFPTQLADVDEVVSTVSLRNRLWKAGFIRSVDWLDDILGKILPVFPVIEPTSSGLGRWSSEPVMAEKFHPHLHISLVKACVAVPRIPVNSLEGPGALTKWFLKRGERPFEAKDHLLRSGRPVSVVIKTQWVSPV